MNSNKAMRPTRMVSMVVLEFLAEADIKTADDEEGDNQGDKD